MLPHGRQLTILPAQTMMSTGPKPSHLLIVTFLTLVLHRLVLMTRLPMPPHPTLPPPHQLQTLKTTRSAVVLVQPPLMRDGQLEPLLHPLQTDRQLGVTSDESALVFILLRDSSLGMCGT